MSRPNGSTPASERLQTALLFHFCRLQQPQFVIAEAVLKEHLQRTYALYLGKSQISLSRSGYIAGLHAADWYIAIGCLERHARAWEILFAAPVTTSDCLLVDALRARAVRLYPRDEERQESAVSEFWSRLLADEKDSAPPILARYDGQRPLVPWLVRVFQNWHISQLRQRAGHRPLPDCDLPAAPEEETSVYWHEIFCQEARESLRMLEDRDMLVLGLRLRYRLNQREVAALLGAHEGTVSRQTSHLREQLLEELSKRLLARGWSGEHLEEMIQQELGALLLDEPRLSAESLGRMLARKGKKLPPQPA